MRFLLVILLLSLPAHAFKYEEKLQNPAKEEQAQQLFREMRCIVCDGESLSGSSAEFSIDMRALIRQKLKKGETPQEIREYLLARYGNAILQKPPIQSSTYLLWFSPLILLLAGIIIISRRKRNEN